jgi:adenosylmethionine-8-amino-7-oxononanoate aminotransferase
VAVRGQGVYLWDAEGRRYLDFSGSAAVSMIGHGDAEVTRAIAEQAAALEFVHSSQFTTTAAEQFASELLEFAGPGFRGGAVYFTSGGSEAIESALKLARQYQVEIGQPARFRMLSRGQSYHGSTLGAMQVSGNRRRRDLYLPMMREQADFEHVSLPYCYRCQYGCQDCARRYAAEVEQALVAAGEEAAAFILEPVSGATLGAAVPPDGYLQQVTAACANAGALLIADEVMTGCGRTGRNFAVEHWSVTPDLLVLGKGLSSGYTPLGAVVATRRVVDAIANGTGAFVHGFTYNAHPVSVAGGRAALARLRALELVRAADSTREGTAGSALRSALQKLRALSAVGEVRGLGLLWGVEFVADPTSKAPFPPERGFAFQVSEAAARRGLLVYPMQGCVDGDRGDHLLLAPPAVITPEEVIWAVEQLAAAIEEAAGHEAGKPAGGPS